MRVAAIVIATWILCGLLFGCASTEERQYAECINHQTRDAGMGVEVRSCTEWQFGNLSKPQAPMPKPWWQHYGN